MPKNRYSYGTLTLQKPKNLTRKENIYMYFSHQLAKIREITGTTQKQLAEALHISSSAVGQWETSERTPKIERLVEIADFFSVSTDLLLSGDRKVSPENFKTYEELSIFNSNKDTLPEPSEQEKQADLIRETFLKLDESDRYILMGRAMELLKLQEKNTDKELKRA